MMLLPMLKGGSVANEWQPMSALMCSAPTSFCRIFIAAKNGRSGQPVHSPEGRGGTSAASLAADWADTTALRGGTGAPDIEGAATAAAGSAPAGTEADDTGALLPAGRCGAHLSRKAPMPLRRASTEYSPNCGNTSLPTIRVLAPCW